MACKSDNILPEEKLECNTCQKKFTNVLAYRQHMSSSKHQTKVTEEKLCAMDLTDGSDDDEEGGMSCEVCRKRFSGYLQYQAHLHGQAHAKNMKKNKLKQQLETMHDVQTKENEDDDTDDDGILPKPFARCKICQKEFSGPESYKMHLNSAGHKKKLKQSQALQTLKDNHDGDATKSGEEIFSKCDICQKSFSGVVPYQIHMQSGSHKKSLERKKAAEEVKEFCDNDDLESGYVCKECKKTFSDPLAFKSHLANNSHEKQKAKTALLEFLNAHPEIVFVSPLDKGGSGNESDSDHADSEFYLICKLCQFSFTGPESAQDHVKSRKHTSLKKEKKMQKLLKEKMKNSSNKTSNDKKSQNDESPAKDISSKGKNRDDFELI